MKAKRDWRGTMKLKALGLGILLLLVATAAPAAIITLTQGQLLNNTIWGSDDPGDTRGINWQAVDPGMPNVNTTTGVFFTTSYVTINNSQYYTTVNNFLFGAMATDLGVVDIESEGFGLTVTNWNNQNWDFAVGAFIDGSEYLSPFVTLTPGRPGQSATLIAYFGDTLTIGDDDAFGLFGRLSGSTESDQYHFEVNPVPEPGTMLLLGSGLIGLAGWGRKKFRK